MAPFCTLDAARALSLWFDVFIPVKRNKCLLICTPLQSYENYFTCLLADMSQEKYEIISYKG